MLKPLGARVLVKRLEAPRPTSSLIEIPDNIAQATSQYGLVLAVGKLVQGGIDIGDTVILSNYAGAPVNVRIEDMDIEAIVVDEGAILAVVEGV